jgi:hypothetical protein
VKRLGNEIRRELARFGPAAGMADLVEAWPEVVGAQIARNAWPARLARDRTLHVSTSSSAWAFELTQLERKLLERLGSALGDAAPARLRFAPGRLPELSPEHLPEPSRAVPQPSPAHLERAAEMTASIAAESLRKVVAEAAAASLARASVDRSL